jgi:hypothetical protein
MKKIVLATVFMTTLTVNANENPLSISLLSSKIDSNDSMRINASYKKNDVIFKVGGEKFKVENNIKLYNSSITYQPEFKLDDILMFDAEIGVYSIDQEKIRHEKSAFYGLGLTLLLYKDLIEIRTGLHKYIGKEFKKIFKSSKISYFSLNYNISHSTSINFEIGSKGNSSYQGVGLKYKF